MRKCVALIAFLSAFGLSTAVLAAQDQLSAKDVVSQINLLNVEQLIPKPELSLSCTYQRSVGNRQLLYRHIRVSKSGGYSFDIMHYGKGKSALSCTYLASGRRYCHIQCCDQGTTFDLLSCQKCDKEPRIRCHSY